MSRFSFAAFHGISPVLYALDESADAAAIERGTSIHGAILTWIVMMTRGGVEAMLFYGKRLMARRIGLPPPIMCPPTIEANGFGLREIERMFDLLGPLGEPTA